MRPSALLPLLLVGCGPQQAGAPVNGVDINAAAVEAQQTIDNYAATTAAAANAARRPAAVPTPRATPAATPSSALLDPPAPGPPGGLPDDRTPVSEAPFTPDSAQGAANVVQVYYALIGEKKYRQAWALWGHGGKDSGMTAAAFAASFDTYDEYRANVGAPGEIDAGMSQRRVTVPVQVYGRLKTGRQFGMLLSAQLHRIVPGVSVDHADEAWRIRSIDVPPAPK